MLTEIVDERARQRYGQFRGTIDRHQRERGDVFFVDRSSVVADDQ
ncbi:hypothetical protein [Saccharothrix sp. NRRL B-16314]|nr:hypothetical protein [Saccharothrix sp. NRRL B-16314]